jgi:hypothetical protein
LQLFVVPTASRLNDVVDGPAGLEEQGEVSDAFGGDEGLSMELGATFDELSRS